MDRGNPLDSNDPMYFTDDGVRIEAGLRVFTNDWRWGTVMESNWAWQDGTPKDGVSNPGGKYFDGWFDVMEDNGRKALLNRDRMTTRPPAGADDDPQKEARQT